MYASQTKEWFLQQEAEIDKLLDGRSPTDPLLPNELKIKL